MGQSIEESLLQAIKNDDTKAFNALAEKAQCGAYRLGRFPVLSLMYLYKSRRLISGHEEKLLKVTDFKVLREPAEVSKRFSSKAGKCLRLYFDEVVSPLEMLLILDKTKKLKRIYPLAKPAAAVKERLKLIYSIRYSLTVKFEGDDIILDRRPLSYREKKNIATLCLCAVLGVTVAVGVPVTTVALIPKPVEGEVTKLSQIDFNSDREYTLKRDIVLPDNYSVAKVNCKIVGGGNKLVFGKGATLGELNGTISDLTIESFGAVFTSVAESAAIQNVTVNVYADLALSEGTALVAVTNFGIIDGVTVNVSGKINALSPSEENAELTFGGLVLNNSYRYISSTQTVYRGVVKNCTVNYSQFSLEGGAEANASFGGVAGINSGYLQDCTVKGAIAADTFDIAGVCSVNNGLLSGNVNEAELSQTSAETGWNPVASGIVLNNTFAVESCENRGRISAVSSCGQFEVTAGNEPAVSAAGIAYLNRGSSSDSYIRYCTNSGSVECRAEYRNAYSAGICLSSSGGIDSCTNSGAVAAETGGGNEIYLGGISAIAYGDVHKSVNEGALSATGGSVYAGGISAHSCAQFLQCLSSGDITVAAGKACVGGILGFSEVTSYGRYVYCGSADYCISKSKISVAATGGDPAFVGGIAGLVSEKGYPDGGAVTYFGGAITHCYFIGECASEVSYFGNIAGVCGANIYDGNSYEADTFEGTVIYHNFENNYYLVNSSKAFGAAMIEDGSFLAVADKGAEGSSLEEIQNTEAYRSILTTLGK